MSLRKGDHLVIKRDGKVVEGEGYHEFEVMDEMPEYKSPKPDDPDKRSLYLLPSGIRIVE